MLTYIPCTPYKAEIFDVMESRMVERTITKFAVRYWEQTEKPTTSAVEVGPDRWMLIVPCPEI